MGLKDLVWSLAVCFVQSGPVLRRVLGVKRVGLVSIEVLPRWTMSSSVGFGVTQVRSWEGDRAGQRSELPSPRWLMTSMTERFATPVPRRASPSPASRDLRIGSMPPALSS